MGLFHHAVAVLMQAQVCAAGALLNIIGPELERSKEGVSQRKGFGNIMAQILTLAITFEALYPELHIKLIV